MKIFDIKSIPEDILGIVGGKARGLYLLNKYGFKVPGGFIVMDAETEEDYKEAAKAYISSGLKKVAVRSSATLEDGKDFSSAGQFETVLNVEGEEAFIAALKTCLSSLTNERATTYSKTFLKSEESKMTIVVQEMVTASVAGVLFTKNPQDQSTTLVEAVKGLGEQLVSGQVSAEQYIVKDGAFDRGDKSLLTDEQVNNIAGGAKCAEESFGVPMDLEWAISEDGQINWLQARPITVNQEVTIDELDCNFDLEGNVLTTCNIREVMAGAVTPLTLTTNIYALDYGIRKILYKNGCAKKLEDLPPYSCLCNYNNQMFFNLTKIFLINHNCYLSTQDALELSICGRVLHMPDINKEDANPIKKIFNTFAFLKYAMNAKPALKGMDKLAAKIPTVFDYTTNDPKQLYEQCCNNLWILNEATFFHYWTSWYSGSQCNMFLTIEDKKFASREELESLMAGALTQIDDIESAQILIGMKNVAEKLKATNPEVVNLSTEELTEYLKNLEGEDKACLDAFFARHGHRGIKEFEFRSLSWRDDMNAFACSLRSVLCGKDDSNDRNVKSWDEYAKEILAKDNYVARKTLRSFINKARKGVYSREYTKSKCVFISDHFKKAYRQIANLLVEQGVLPEVDLIYFLKHDEIGELINGKSSLVKTAIARRRLFPEQNACRYEEVFIGKPEPLKPVEVDQSIMEYVGTPVSRGIATGRARVVHSVEDANKLLAGEIMVAELTDIGWSPYYCKIEGLVTEIGSSLSHGVVVAREYSLPTVVNVSGAMTSIKDGDLIRLDGTTGKVTILERQ